MLPRDTSWPEVGHSAAQGLGFGTGAFADPTPSFCVVRLDYD